MKNQATRKLEKDLLKLHTKYFADTNKLAVLHLILDSKIADAKDMLKPQGVPEKEINSYPRSHTFTQQILELPRREKMEKI